MVQPTPLHPGAPQPEEPLDSPEVLVLNALLHSGRFDPQAYAIDEDMLAGYQQAWRFCQEHQDKVGTAPSIELFARTFPAVEMLAGVDPRWAADRLRAAHYEREVRRTLHNATRALREGDLDSVREAVREIAMPNPLSKPKGMNVTDIDSVALQSLKIGFNTPWPTLNALTNGHARGTVRLLGARFGVGKSQMVPCYAISAAEQGARVAIASCEMPMRQYVKRIHRRMAHGNRQLQHSLASPEEDVRRSALEQLPELRGAIEVFDHSTMRMNLRGIENLMSEYDVVWIDHAGLLSDNTGKRAIEDWHVAAVVSNSLKEYAVRYDVALGAVVQLNRESEGKAIPKSSGISLADAFGQDADDIHLLKAEGVSSMLHIADKVREGHGGRYYTKFEPACADFSEISADEARVRKMQDESRTSI